MRHYRQNTQRLYMLFPLRSVRYFSRYFYVIWNFSKISHYKKECALAHSRASRGRLRQSTSSRECASLAHECLLCNREFLGISYYTKNGSKLCNLLTDIRCRLSTFRPVSSIYMAPTTGSYGRSQVRRLQLPQTLREDPELSGVSSPLRPHHRSRGLRSS